jgi:hypothetical protein
MGLWSIKAQEIRAGGFTLRFGAHDDASDTCYLQVNGATEGQHIMFSRDGEVLSIKPIVIESQADAERRAAEDIERASREPMFSPQHGVNWPAGESLTHDEAVALAKREHDVAHEPVRYPDRPFNAPPPSPAPLPYTRPVDANGKPL